MARKYHQIRKRIEEHFKEGDIGKSKNLYDDIEKLIEELNTNNEELNAINDELNSTNITLEQERKQFLSILNRIPENIYAIDMNTFEILFANKQLEKTIGRDVKGEICYHAIQGKTDVCDFCTNKYIKDTDEPYFWEHYNSVMDKHFYVMDRKIQWTDNREVRFELAIDVTDRKNVEDEIKKLTVAVEQNPATIVITDLKGNIEYVNPFFEKITGYTREEAIGQNPRILQSQKTKPNVYNDLWRTISKGKTWKGHFINKTKNGAEYIEKATIAPIFNKSGKKTHYIAIKEDVTERVSAENKVKRNEAIFRIAFESANIGIMNVSKDGNILYANAECVNIFGYSQEELNSMTVSDIAIPDDKAISQHFIQKSLKDNAYGKAVFEKRYYHKTGHIITCEISSALLHDENGEPLYFISHIKDITQQKQAEAELRHSEEKYRLIADSASDVIWTYNIDKQNFTYVSPSVFSVHGYTQEEAQQLDYLKLYLPEYAQEALERTGKMTTDFANNPEEISKKSFIYQAKMITKDGRPFWAEVKNSYRYNKQGEIEAYGITRNIDDRKKYEEQIQLNNERLNDLLELSQQNISNKHDIFDYALNTAVKVTKSEYGYIYFYSEEKQQFELNTWSKGVMPDCEVMDPKTIYDLDKTGIWGEVVRQRKTIIVNDFKAKNPLKKGYPVGHVALSSFMSIPFFRDQKIVAVVGVANKTERYDQEDVMQLNLLMETVWNIYQKKEAEAKIRKLNDELSEAIATKDKFFNIIAHDLKNPFNSILGFSDLLINKIDEYDKGKIKKFVSAINDSGQNTFKLLENLLQWARSQQDNIPLNPVENNLYEIVYETYMLVSGSAKNKQITVDLDVSEEISIVADSEMLKTIVRNLVSNSLKYTPKNGKIIISGTQNQNETIIKISDTGIGMDEQTKNSLFKIGETKSTEGTNGEKGTGFGLLLCKEFANKHNGKIEVRSELGKGSEFIVTIPLKLKKVDL